MRYQNFVVNIKRINFKLVLKIYYCIRARSKNNRQKSQENH